MQEIYNLCPWHNPHPYRGLGRHVDGVALVFILDTGRGQQNPRRLHHTARIEIDQLRLALQAHTGACVNRVLVWACADLRSSSRSTSPTQRIPY